MTNKQPAHAHGIAGSCHRLSLAVDRSVALFHIPHPHWTSVFPGSSKKYIRDCVFRGGLGGKEDKRPRVHGDSVGSPRCVHAPTQTCRVPIRAHSDCWAWPTQRPVQVVVDEFPVQVTPTASGKEVLVTAPQVLQARLNIWLPGCIVSRGWSFENPILFFFLHPNLSVSPIVQRSHLYGL